MARTKQKNVAKNKRRSNASDVSLFSQTTPSRHSRQSSIVHMFSQNPQIGSQMQMLVQRPQRVALVPYEDSIRENTRIGVQIRPRAIIEEHSPRQLLQIKKKRRYRPGTKALMEIRKLQRTTNPLIARAPFMRLVKELLGTVTRRDDLRIQADAVSALQEASEAYLITYFEAGRLAAQHARRVTIMPSDLALVREILSLFGATFPM